MLIDLDPQEFYGLRLRLPQNHKNYTIQEIKSMGFAGKQLVALFDELTWKAAYYTEYQEELEFMVNHFLQAEMNKLQGESTYPAYDSLFHYLNSYRFTGSPRREENFLSAPYLPGYIEADLHAVDSFFWDRNTTVDLVQDEPGSGDEAVDTDSWTEFWGDENSGDRETGKTRVKRSNDEQPRKGNFNGRLCISVPNLPFC